MQYIWSDRGISDVIEASFDHLVDLQTNNLGVTQQIQG